MSDCLFCRISEGDIPSDIVYQDDEVLAFRDIDPKAPTHILVIPRRHIQSAGQLTAADGALLGRMFEVIAQIARENGLDEGYRVVSNVGAQGGQSVLHLHFHLLGGRQMEWPPG